MDINQELQKFHPGCAQGMPEYNYLREIMRYDFANGGPVTRGKSDAEILIGMQRLHERGRELKWAVKEVTIPDAHSVSAEMIRLDRSDSEIKEEIIKLKNHHRGKPSMNLSNANRYDAGSVSFERDNIMLDPREFDIKHQPFTWRSILPIQPITPGTSEVAYRQFDTSGEADEGSVQDGSMTYVDATGEEFFNKIAIFKKGYKETFAELRRAMFQNAPIQRFKILAVRRSYETKLQKGMMLGHGGFAGFINSPNVPNVQAPLSLAGVNRNWGIPSASDKTPTEVAADIMSMPTKVISEQQSAYGETGFRIALNADKLRFITVTKMGSDNSGSDTTIAKFVLENDPSIEGFDLIHEMTDQGTGTTQLAICYQRVSEYLEAQIADAVIWHAPQFDDLNIKHPSEMEFGGVVNRYPLAMTQLYGI